MAVEEQETRPLFKIYVPSMTKAGVPIPGHILKDFYDLIIERFIQYNAGCTTIPNVVGYYLSDAGKTVEESINIIESAGVFPFSKEELSFYARKLDQDCIRVEEGSFVKAYHCNGEIEPISSFELKDSAGSIGYCIDMDPAQFIYQGDDKEAEVVDIPEKYIITYFSYDEIGQPMRVGRLRENDILQIISESEYDTATNLLFESLLKQLNILNSR